MNEIPAIFERAADQPIETDLSVANGLFVKSYLVTAAGTYLPQHTHAYDHVTVIAAGSVVLWIDAIYQGVFSAPATVMVGAGKKHLFRTEEDDTVILCIHRVGPDGEPEVLREHQLVPSEEAA